MLNAMMTPVVNMFNANGDDDEVGVLIYDDDNVRRCSITNLNIALKRISEYRTERSKMAECLGNDE